MSVETKLTFTQLCWVWRARWRLLGFFLLLIQQLLLQIPTLDARGLKGGDRHPHFRVCAILFQCPQACDWYSPWQGTNKSYGKNNVWKSIALCVLLSNDLGSLFARLGFCCEQTTGSKYLATFYLRRLRRVRGMPMAHLISKR